MTPWHKDDHNPWNGVCVWRELWHDVWNFDKFLRRARAGLRDGIRFMQEGFRG